MADRQSKDIPVDEEGIAGLREMYDGALALFKETSATFGQQQEKYLTGHLKYTESVTQTIGIIAGFGFTAVGKVSATWLFILGEVLIVGSICYGLLRTRYTYTKTIDTLAESSSKASQVLSKRTTYMGTLIAQAVSSGVIPADAKDQIDTLNNEMLVALTPKEHKEDDYFKDYLIEMIVVAGIGVLLVLCSFLNFPWLHLHHWL